MPRLNRTLNDTALRQAVLEWNEGTQRLVSQIRSLPQAPKTSVRKSAPLSFLSPSSPESKQWKKLVPSPSVVLILGKRGSGKSALGYYLLELLHTQKKSYVVGLPKDAYHLLPPHYGVVSRLESAPKKSVVLIDEAYTFYQSRESQTKQAKELLGILGASRKKKQTLIFVAHESRQIDINVIGHVDVLVMKRPSLFQGGLDRPVIREIINKAKVAFGQVKGDKRRFGYVISDPAGFEGLMENETASFWNEQLSETFVEVEKK